MGPRARGTGGPGAPRIRWRKDLPQMTSKNLTARQLWFDEAKGWGVLACQIINSRTKLLFPSGLYHRPGSQKK